MKPTPGAGVSEQAAAANSGGGGGDTAAGCCQDISNRQRSTSLKDSPYEDLSCGYASIAQAEKKKPLAAQKSPHFDRPWALNVARRHDCAAMPANHGELAAAGQWTVAKAIRGDNKRKRGSCLQAG